MSIIILDHNINKKLNLDDSELLQMQPRELISQIWETYTIKAVATSSFQTQSLPLLHMISTICPEMKILFVDTGFHFQETLDYRDQLMDLLHLDIVTVQAISEKNEDEKPLYLTDPDACCKKHKVIPLKNALKGEAIKQPIERPCPRYNCFHQAF